MIPCRSLPRLSGLRTGIVDAFLFSEPCFSAKRHEFVTFIRTRVAKAHQAPEVGADLSLCENCRSLDLYAIFEKASRKFQDAREESPAWDMKDTVFLAVVPDHEMLPLTGHGVQWMVRYIPRTGVVYRLGADEERDPDIDVLARPKELRSEEANLALAKECLTHAISTMAVPLGDGANMNPSQGAFG
ncbi:hypothetical protein N657DRAFT_195423 [Parathielavia appendiculata]|uniref:Uncharacterized protein n=1 Tax=Parathielavia appendiculata TaxID=2587402 RepID=A0AAN6U642_9PEZI|nr:hypothetical protein N657DRAFT_195423 [Parathielavia appendiculata]